MNAFEASVQMLNVFLNNVEFVGGSTGKFCADGKRGQLTAPTNCTTLPLSSSRKSLNPYVHYKAAS